MTSERTRMVRFVAFIAGSFPDRIHRRTVSGLIPRAKAISWTVRSFTLTQAKVAACCKLSRRILRKVYSDSSWKPWRLASGVRISPDFRSSLRNRYFPIAMPRS